MNTHHDLLEYPVLLRALNALWDRPATAPRIACMDALIVVIDDLEAQSDASAYMRPLPLQEAIL